VAIIRNTIVNVILNSYQIVIDISFLRHFINITFLLQYFMFYDSCFPGIYASSSELLQEYNKCSMLLVELLQNYSVIPFPCPLKYLPKFWYSEFFCGGDVKKWQIYGGNRTQMTLMTVNSTGVNSAFQAAQSNE
jgi:hypothetical protein